MKLWILAGLFSLAAIPVANASESACEPDETRRADVRIEAPAPTVVPPRVATATAPREVAEATVVRPADTTRRRGGSQKRIPDAVLIGPRGAL